MNSAKEARISFLLVQHNNEVLSPPDSDLKSVINQTFDDQFNDVLSMCLFVPFMKINVF